MGTLMPPGFEASAFTVKLPFAATRNTLVCDEMVYVPRSSVTVFETAISPPVSAISAPSVTVPPLAMAVRRSASVATVVAHTFPAQTSARARAANFDAMEPIMSFSFIVFFLRY